MCYHVIVCTCAVCIVFCMGSEHMVFLVFKAVFCIILSVCMCCQVSINERYSCAGRHDVTTSVQISSSICYCFRDHPLKGSSKMVSEDSLTVTYLHGSSKTTFRVKLHGHLPWVLQSWSPIYLLLLHRPPSRALQRS